MIFKLNYFKITLQSNVWRPKGPSQEAFFVRDAPKSAFSGPQIKMIAPPGPPFGAKEAVNDPPRALKRQTVQVRIQKYK